MLGFLIFVFLYLFMLLAHNTQKKSRSSLMQSLVYAGLVLLIISMFSVVGLGIVLFSFLFVPFFFFPAKKNKHHYRFDQEKAFKDFFEQMHRQQGQRKQGAWQDYHQSEYPSPPKTGMSLQEAANLLGVPTQATVTQIKSAYRKLMLKHHPDKGGSAEYAAKLNVAKDMMMQQAAHKHSE